MRNNWKKVISLGLGFIAVWGLFSGCAAPQQAKSGAIQITDQLGRVVTLDRIPRRIISLAPSNTEIIYALGLEDRLVGVTDYDDYPPEARTKPSIGGFSTPNIEKVIAAAPDLILATSIHGKKIIPQLEEKGLTVFALAPKTLDDVLASIKLVGEVTGKEEEAAKLITEIRNGIKAVTDRTDKIPETERPAVFYLIWHDPLTTSGIGTLHHELIQKAGGRNAFPEIVGTQAIGLELLVARNPQVMIAGVSMGSGENKTFQYLKAEARLGNTDAGKNGRIYQIDINLTGRAGPRIIKGLEQFARSIHPEIFGPPDNN